MRNGFGVAAAAVLLVTTAVRAQVDAGTATGHDVTELSLDDLLAAPTHVASQKAESVRETPGVVTVITREEIQAAGARDLIDVLMLVPGFSPPAIDVEGVTDMGFRGIWGHEGKILLMVDGEPLNEMLYDDNALGFHIPVDQIQSVEIIRGPGSALYGGWAELGVVNVITRGPDDFHGVSASVHYTERVPSSAGAETALGQRDLNLGFAQKSVFGLDGLNVSLSGFIGQGTRSSGTYSDFAGDSYLMASNASNGPYNSEIDPLFFNLGIQYKDLKLRILIDDYRLAERDSYGTDTGATSGIAPLEKFYTFVADASYDLKLGKLTISPRVTYKYQLPWQVTDTTVTDYFNVSVSRLTARLTASYDFNDDLRVMAGTEDYVENASVNNASNGVVGSQNFFTIGNQPGQVSNCSAQDTVVTGTDANGNPINACASVGYSNLAAFGEIQYRSFLGTLTVGARYEHHSAFGDSFVPRIALTKVIDRFHFKLLYSYAFRAPGIEDIALAPQDTPITPEHTKVLEAEVGYEWGEHFYVSANVFDISLHQPIVYYFDPNTQLQYYVNFPRTGSEGFELDARLKYSWGYVYGNYSFYTAYSPFEDAAKSDVPVYAVPGTDSLLMAMPAHKITLHAKFALTDQISLNPSLVYFSQRWGVTSVDANGNNVISQVPSVVLANVFLTLDLTGSLRGAQVGFGMYNLLDTQWSYLQAYNSGHAPIPAPGREVGLRISYTPPKPDLL